MYIRLKMMDFIFDLLIGRNRPKKNEKRPLAEAKGRCLARWVNDRADKHEQSWQAAC